MLCMTSCKENVHITLNKSNDLSCDSNKICSDSLRINISFIFRENVFCDDFYFIIISCTSKQTRVGSDITT